LAYFKEGFGDSGSFLDIGGHRFYVAKPFPEEATELLAKAVETITPSTLATTAGSPEIQLRSLASHAITPGQTRRSRHMASL
jgi:hypothetical protein